MQVLEYVYDPVKDKFLSPQPFESWSLDSNDDWQAPITYPSITKMVEQEQKLIHMKYIISWNETKYQADNTKGWEAINQTTNRKHLPNTIGMAQLGCPNRRTLKCLDLNLGSTNGGVIGKTNKVLLEKILLLLKHLQELFVFNRGLELIDYLLVAGGGGGGAGQNCGPGCNGAGGGGGGVGGVVADVTPLQDLT